MITLSESRRLETEKVLKLYKANNWSAAQKPEELINALKNSFGLITAWDGEELVGLANAISDGYLVIYYPHLLILPEYQGKGIGSMIMKRFAEKYSGFHQQILVADGRAVDFYRKCGFVRSGSCEPMWIYSGHDHD